MVDWSSKHAIKAFYKRSSEQTKATKVMPPVATTEGAAPEVEFEPEPLDEDDEDEDDEPEEPELELELLPLLVRPGALLLSDSTMVSFRPVILSLV